MSAPRPSEADVEAMCAQLTEWLDERPDDTPHETARRILAARDAEHEREVAGPTWDAVTLRGIAAHAVDRAEAAERALADLRCEIKALADEYAENGAQREAAGRPAWPNNVARDLRALLPRDDAAGAGGAG